MSEACEPGEVKYLNFIQEAAESVYNVATTHYISLKEKTFEGSGDTKTKFRDIFEDIEGRLKPLFGTYLIGFSQSALKFADSLVEAGVAFGSDAVTKAQTKTKESLTGLHLRVQKTLDAEIVTDVKSNAHARYTSAHGAIISSPTYAHLYQATVSYSKWAWSLPIVQAPVEMIYSNAYPRVKTVIDPVVTKVEPYVKALEEHLEPRAGEE